MTSGMVTSFNLLVLVGNLISNQSESVATKKGLRDFEKIVNIKF